MKKYTIIAVAVAALLVIWGIWSASQQGGRAGESGVVSAAGGAAGAAGIVGSGGTGETSVVTVGEVQRAVTAARPGSIAITVEGPAVVEPYRELSLRSGIAGTVVLAPREGDTFESGDILLQFDGTAFRAARRQAELSLEQARVDLQRAELAVRKARSDLADRESLFASGSIPRTERDAAADALSAAVLEERSSQIRVDQSVLALETAEYNLESTEVRAPYPGVVLMAGVGIGDVVSSGTVLMTFADIGRLRVRAEVDEFDVGVIEPGMAAVITADALETETVTTTVEQISPGAQIINNISIFTVSAVVRSDQAPLRPGMSADLTVLVSDDTGLIVPSTAVSSVRGRSYLEVYENGEVVTKRVVAGTDDRRNTVILDGLSEGDLVVLPESAAFSLGIPATSGSSGSGSSGSTGSSFIPVPIPGSGGSR